MHERYEQKLALFLLDLLAFFGALNLAIWLRYSANLPFSKGGPAPWREIFVAFPFVALAWVVANALLGSYRTRQSSLMEIGAVVRATLLTFLAILSATFFYRGFSYSRGMMAFFMPLVLVLVTAERVGLRALRRRVMSRFAGRERVVILGKSRIGDALVSALRADRDYYEVVGRVECPQTAGEGGDESGATTSSPGAPLAALSGARAAEPLALALAHEQGLAGVAVLGSVHELDRLCSERHFDSLVLVDRRLSEDLVLESIEACMRHQVAWSMIPGVHDLLVDRARVDLIDGIPLVGTRRTNIVGFNWMMKRLFDVIASLVLLALGGPVMALIAIAIKASSKGPVIYTQQRVGYRGRVFPFLKFRSMHLNSDDAIHREYTRRWITENKAHTEDGTNKVHKIVNDPRVFAVGRFIRKFSVDELPQLLNVLRGDMSLIGPRPALPYEVEVYREWHRRRFEAPPGITGLWQVSGRNRLSFDEMIKLDIEYIENWSMLLDLQILWRTVRVVLFEHAY